MFLFKLFLLPARLLIRLYRKAVLSGLHLQLAQSRRNILTEVHSGRFAKRKKRFPDTVKLFSCRLTFRCTRLKPLILMDLIL